MHRRLELFVDILGTDEHRALALPGLNVSEFIEAILAEFRSLEHLGHSASVYQLQRADNEDRLDDERPLEEQVVSGERLILRERLAPIPVGVQRAHQDIYLCEQQSGAVYKLQWLPALIGRQTDTSARLSNADVSGRIDRVSEELDEVELSVNLGQYPAAMRVARRQALITEEDGHYWVQNLSKNSMSIVDDAGESETVSAAKHPLHSGDLIHFERSGIRLKFMNIVP
ncbi:hypothetical protein KFU94_49240 [Chloroflexi bacterium TSY]|nr:hypothetical protein [Chloroflexi bacterium TSY]